MRPAKGAMTSPLFSEGINYVLAYVIYTSSGALRCAAKCTYSLKHYELKLVTFLCWVYYFQMGGRTV